MTNRDIFDISKLIRACEHSWQGLKAAWNERAFRQELWILAVVVPAGWWLGDGAVERAMLIGSWMLVLVVELLNSAIEAAIDRIGREPHELAGRAKDLGSAAVLGAISLAALVWGMLILG